MKREGKSRRRTAWLALLAAALILGLAAGSSLAYFTTYATAKGSLPITLGHRSEIEEKFEDWKKEITIANTGEVDCYVRVKVFAGEEFTLEYDGESAGSTEKWTQGTDGYWYYSGIVPVGGKTEQTLTVSITLPEGQAASFNVVVIQECTPVLYHENGTPYADWTLAAETGEGAGE